MTLVLPTPIKDYFAADRNDPAALARCFAEDAVVRDENRTHSGLDAILRWKSETTRKFSYVTEPFALTRDGDRLLVTSHVSGDFPGSPIDLRYGFRLSGDRIVELEIAP